MKCEKKLLEQLDEIIINGDHLSNIIKSIENTCLIQEDNYNYLDHIFKKLDSKDFILGNTAIKKAACELKDAFSNLLCFISKNFFPSRENPRCYTWKKDRYASSEEYDREYEYIRENLTKLCDNVMGAYKNFREKEKRLVEIENNRTTNNLSVVGNNNIINAQNNNGNQINNIGNKKIDIRSIVKWIVGIAITITITITIKMGGCLYNNLSHSNNTNQNDGIQQGNSQGNIYNGDVINNYGPINQKN